MEPTLREVTDAIRMILKAVPVHLQKSLARAIRLFDEIDYLRHRCDTLEIDKAHLLKQLEEMNRS